MKLFTKANRYFGISVVITLVFSSFAVFYGITYLFQTESKEKLEVDEFRLIQLLQENSTISSLPPFFEIKKSHSSIEKIPEINTVELFDPVGKENEKYIELSSIRKINGEYYSLKVRHATVESEELMFVVIGSFMIVMLISFVILFFINRSISKKLWLPFNRSLQNLQSFSIEKGEIIHEPKTNIAEFDLLNESLEKFSSKLIQDYKSLQEFAENASHEIQTPLSIILLNLEETIQADLDKETSQKIYNSYQAAMRLSRLNEKLLLLTKIDNQQFNNIEEIDLTEICSQLLNEYSPLFETRGISVSTEFKEPFRILIDRGLASILISNLLSNALKHGDPNSKIEIIITGENMIVINKTSNQIDMSKLFDRFHKQNLTSDSLGLGLSISKKIADIAGLSIDLSSNNDKFIVQLSKK